MRHRGEELLQREFDVALPEGKILHVLGRGARLSASGTKFSGYLLVIDDISDLAEAERAKAWAEVAQRLAHEIKNPLTPIKLSTERLQRRFRIQVDNTEVFDVCTKAIIDQVERLQRLIADFSTLAQVKSPVVVARGEAVAPGNELPPAMAEPIASHLGNGELLTMEGLTHFGPMEDGERVAQAVLAHLTQ